jgi:hypothetical protein
MFRSSESTETYEQSQAHSERWIQKVTNCPELESLNGDRPGWRGVFD